MPEGFSCELLEKENESDFVFCQNYLENAWKEPVYNVLIECCQRVHSQRCFLLKREGKPIGQVFYQYDSKMQSIGSLRHWITGFYVAEEYRKSGVAFLFLDEAISQLTHIEKIHAAINFSKPKLARHYLKNGWEDMGIRAEEPSGMHYIFRKNAGISAESV